MPCNIEVERREALVRHTDDGAVAINNYWVENQIRPWAFDRSNWLFAGSLRKGQRAANIMSLTQLAKILDLDPQIFPKDVVEQIPSINHSELDVLLPHNVTA